MKTKKVLLAPIRQENESRKQPRRFNVEGLLDLHKGRYGQANPSRHPRCGYIIVTLRMKSATQQDCRRHEGRLHRGVTR